MFIALDKLENQKLKQAIIVVPEKFISDYGRPDRRLRLIYDNGTESDLLIRSFQRALYKDKASRRITTPDHGPLFSQNVDLELKDRFGAGVEPQEWFLAPLAVIREAIDKLMDGTIQDFRYDPETARIVRHEPGKP
jgi:hypothetical protein